MDMATKKVISHVNLMQVCNNLLLPANLMSSQLILFFEFGIINCYHIVIITMTPVLTHTCTLIVTS